ncbi:hypothetical protein ACX8XP_14770 [Calditrichota bacterium LG25]
MGLLFKRFHPYAYCSKCKINYVQEINFFYSNISKWSKCPKCGSELISNDDLYSKDYYVLKGTKIKFPVKSIFGKIFVIYPTFILIFITLFFFLGWLIEIFEFAFNEAAKRIYKDLIFNIFGIEWASFIIIILTYYYLFLLINFLLEFFSNKKQALLGFLWKTKIILRLSL